MMEARKDPTVAQLIRGAGQRPGLWSTGVKPGLLPKGANQAFQREKKTAPPRLKECCPRGSGKTLVRKKKKNGQVLSKQDEQVGQRKRKEKMAEHKSQKP